MLAYPDKIIAVKAEDIPDIVGKYLNPEYVVIGMLLPKVPLSPKVTEQHLSLPPNLPKGR